MSGLAIVTDHKYKSFKYRDEVPKQVLVNQFDWLEPDEIDGFIQYRKVWYHLSEFVHMDCTVFTGYDSFLPDSFFSGILIKISKDGEQYKIATYFS